MSYIDDKGEFHLCTFDIAAMARQRIQQEWKDKKSLKNLIALVKSEHKYRKKYGGVFALIKDRWRGWFHMRWKRGLVAAANRTPLNVASLKKLKEAKIRVNRDYLYLLQLMDWGLKQGLTPSNKVAILKLVMSDIKGEEPEKVTKYFENRTSQPILKEEDLTGVPEDAAKSLIMFLAARLKTDEDLKEAYKNDKFIRRFEV